MKPAGILLVCLAAVLTFAIPPAQTDSRPGYVGDEKCLSCHPKQKEFPRTAHHLTSRRATRESIAGSFAPGKNVLKTPEPELQYRMDARDDGFFQTGVVGVPPQTVSISHRFDFVIGSGRKGQTYLYWGRAGDAGEADRLFQLPVSYWTEIASWVNSPGYGDRSVDFSRPVLARCLECHATYAEPIPDPAAASRYRRMTLVLGVTCERCHGPGAQHSAVNSVPDAKPVDQLIVSPAKLPRDRQLALCSLCHGGVGVSKTPVFSFKVGDTLEDHLQLATPKTDEPLDVHGSQVELLQRSKCFKSSNMTCSTCHDVHLPQRDVVDFSARCLACHKVESCGLFPRRGRTLTGKCVDCHLPNQTSNVIFSTHAGTRIRPKVRNHWIKVY
ncbi:MAG TPA: multiheme c-type cytochrome [Pyrinomonadaceae bacterium]|nr:multiheme c-type cytochrome [Pyrinomonadaceae bacterium]